MSKASPSEKESPPEAFALLDLLRTRFEKNRSRHPDLDWKNVELKLKAQPQKLAALQRMEDSGGAPDLVWRDEETNAYVFCDCAPETPQGRRSLCYDDEALEARKEHKPEGSAVTRAMDMGIALMNETEYRRLQQLGSFDAKTSSWIATPPAIRKLGGALFCDRRYNQVFVYHNGAASYYAARGFRGLLSV